MKSFSIFNWLIATTLLTIASCDCEDAPFLTEGIPFPNLFIVTEVEEGDGIIFIRFNQDLDTNSVALGRSIFIEGNSVFSGPLNVFRNQISLDPCDIGCLSQSGCKITIRISGDTTDNRLALHSTSGRRLDGNKDGNSGGDFVQVFDINYFCDPGPPIVTIPAANLTPQIPNNGYSVISGKLTFILTFSQKMDASSVNSGTSFKVALFNTSSTPIPGALKWNNLGNQVTFTSDLNYNQYCSGYPNNPCIFFVTLSGDASGVKNAFGIALDGDKNGSPGGNRTIYFR